LEGSREVWNERRTETIDDLFAPGAIGHTENGDQGPAEFKAASEGLLNAFPDIQIKVEDTAADGDHVVVRWRARGTHRGDGLGMPATGRPVDFRGMTWLTFRNGIIVEAGILGTWAASSSRLNWVFAILANHDLTLLFWRPRG
jgi:steroid delta-isomerase-like uncharacterized protein